MLALTADHFAKWARRSVQALSCLWLLGLLSDFSVLWLPILLCLRRSAALLPVLAFELCEFGATVLAWPHLLGPRGTPLDHSVMYVSFEFLQIQESSTCIRQYVSQTAADVFTNIVANHIRRSYSYKPANDKHIAVKPHNIASPIDNIAHTSVAGSDFTTERSRNKTDFPKT